MACPALDVRRSSPIQRLPVELLSYIFSLGTHSVDDDEDPACPAFDAETIKTPLILSQVNRQWRNIARNTPSLWTSICVTAALVDVGDGVAPPLNSPRLHASHLTTYLSLSRKSPLDILIDARDQDWDFSEPEIPSDYGCDTYAPPFSPSHMGLAISLLLPHIARWRSMTILTDSWAPMYVALRLIQPAITAVGAPALESLALMRCNDFVSYSPTFRPSDMRDPAFLHLSETSSPPQNILPRLRHLTLRGVHVHWASLATILSHSQPGLDTLDLSSHCLDVRPTVPEFHHLLSACPKLTKLVVNGSGARDRDEVSNGDFIHSKSLQPAPLPALHDLTLGYRSVSEAQAVLELLDAPKTRMLRLEDATHPGELEEVDAGGLLTYLGTGQSPTREIFYSYTSPDGVQHQVPITKSTALVPRQLQVGTAQTAAEEHASRTMFPLLAVVTLHGVKTCLPPLHTFFSSLPNLRSLELSGMPMQAIRALLPPHVPSDPSVYTTTPCPCPQLQSLCIRWSEHQNTRDFVFLVGALAIERPEQGRVSRVGTTVKIIREVLQEDEGAEEGEVMDCASEIELQQYEAAGAPHDPGFESHYARSASAH
ncbi:hypothetical protein LshimejAT787_0901190 [Lyophyllum shimeji]|uniref:F-box domain-containing protein n=1 Tax=Lyophyllum shimeji TaxID=47721 RepID=A0A9P3PSV2_LYOSH|nr:hypothetical protein LshimejAT787_0901190 [Lyophyllum shimeji]